MRWFSSVALVSALWALVFFAPTALGQIEGVSVCVWGEANCSVGGSSGAGATAGNARFAAYEMNQVNATWQGLVATALTYVQVSKSGTGDTFLEVSGSDPGGDFAWNDTDQCFDYSGSDGKFLFSFTGSGHLAAGGGVNDAWYMKFGFEADGESGAFPLETYHANRDLSGQVAGRYHSIAYSVVVDITSGDCVTGWITTNDSNLSDPVIPDAYAYFLEITPQNGVVAGTAQLRIASGAGPHTVTADDIENGVVLIDCSLAACDVNLPAMTAGKGVTIVDYAGATLDVIPSGQQIEDTAASGNQLRSGGILGDKVSLMAGDSAYLMVMGMKGSWTDAGAP